MGMFDMTTTAGLKESGNFLTAGIHKAKFAGITLGNLTSQKDGSTYATMTLSLDVEGHGNFTHNFFEPKSAERTQSQFGLNPSPAEHFMVSVRQIVDALDPEVGEKLVNDDITINGKKVSTKNMNFSQLVELVKYITDPFIGTEVEIKLVPQSNGFNAIPGFPARINRAGQLGIATRFIGHGLTLSQSEMNKIEAAKNSRPTNMAIASNPTLDGVADALGLNTTEDLPF